MTNNSKLKVQEWVNQMKINNKTFHITISIIFFTIFCIVNNLTVDLYNDTTLVHPNRLEYLEHSVRPKESFSPKYYTQN